VHVAVSVTSDPTAGVTLGAESVHAGVPDGALDALSLTGRQKTTGNDGSPLPSG
jgi:hypothetical protein